jgi:hypothetical protein
LKSQVVGSIFYFMKQGSTFGVRGFRSAFTLVEVSMVVCLILSLLWVTALAFSVWKDAEAKALCKIRVHAYNNAFSSFAMMAGFWPGDTLPSGLFSDPNFLEDTLGSSVALEASGISCGDSRTSLVWVFPTVSGETVDPSSITMGLFPKLSEGGWDVGFFCATSASGFLFSTDKFWLDCPRHDWLNDAKGWYSWQDPGPVTEESLAVLGYVSATEYLAAMASSGSGSNPDPVPVDPEQDTEPVVDDPLVGGDPAEEENPPVIPGGDGSGDEDPVLEDPVPEDPDPDDSEEGNGNNGHGNNDDGVDVSNPGQGSGGPNGEDDPSGDVDDEGGNGGGNSGQPPKDKDKDKKP